jgi:hypothetical protein
MATKPCSYLSSRHCGSSSAVERKLPKLDVAGSIPVSRSKQSLFQPLKGAFLLPDAEEK